MIHLTEKPIVFFDLEGTGTDTKNDRIVEVSFHRYEGGELVERFDSLVDPTIPIPADSTEIHGITDDDVKEKPTFRDIADKISSIMDGAIIAGYNIIGYDLPLLKAEYKRIRKACPFVFSASKIFDAYRMYCKLKPRSLEAAYAVLVGEAFEQTHRAGDDVDMTVAVFKAMARQNQELPYVGDLFQSVEGIDSVSKGDRMDLEGHFRKKEKGVVLGFGEHRDKLLSEVYYEYSSWFDWASYKIPGFSLNLSCALAIAIPEEFADD